MEGRCIVVMARRPVPGAVKTRLAVEFGDDAACALYEAFLRDTVDACRAANAATMVAFTPGTERDWFAGLGADLLLARQPDAPFGERLKSAMQEAFRCGFGPVALAGSDTPHLTAETLDAALDVAARGAVALVPTADGGYSVLALGRPQPGLFDNIDWSSGRELSQTIARTRELGLGLELLPTTFDIDTPTDLRQLARRIATGETHCSRTAEALARFKVGVERQELVS